ncbi:MAG: hypothetical protein ABJB12_19175 [Pseudomonadota bacterium]
MHKIGLLVILFTAWGCSGSVQMEGMGAGGDGPTSPADAGGAIAAPPAAGGASAAGGAVVSMPGTAQGGASQTSYPCRGGFVYERLGGAGEGGSGGEGGWTPDYPNVVDVPWTGPVDGDQSCVIGQSICSISSVPEVLIGVRPWASCEPFSGSIAACSATPTCACICSHNPSYCQYRGCSCTDANGVATLSCQET